MQKLRNVKTPCSLSKTNTSIYSVVIAEKNGKNHMNSSAQVRICSSASGSATETPTYTDGKVKDVNTCIQMKRALAWLDIKVGLHCIWPTTFLMGPVNQLHPMEIKGCPRIKIFSVFKLSCGSWSIE